MARKSASRQAKPIHALRLPLMQTLVLLLTALGFALPAQAQTVAVQNGATLRIANGVLDLRGSTLDLGGVGEAARLEETESGYVTGGSLTATRVLDAPSGVNIANLGAIITSSRSLGATTITRGHIIQYGGGHPSIQRYYDIVPEVNNGLEATLEFHYDDAELGGLPEEELELFRSADGGATWSRRGFAHRDSAANTVTLSGIDAFSRWTLGASSQPLPVELTAFEATLDGDAVQLTWATASETNNAGFHVERALAAGSADEGAEEASAAWQAIGFVGGAGTTSAPRNYGYRDAALPFGAERLRYRLRQVDLDGTASFGPAIEVQLGAPEQIALHAPYPNPVAEQAMVRYELPQAARVRLAVYNALGQRTAVLVDSPQPAGRKELRLATHTWPSGVYFVQLQVGSTAHMRKITVIR